MFLWYCVWMVRLFDVSDEELSRDLSILSKLIYLIIVRCNGSTNHTVILFKDLFIPMHV